jgi:prepilin-type N-terminal cleavage/methylation domain-containing protein
MMDMNKKYYFNIASDHAGFTIIEILIAIAIFSIGFMAVGALQTSSLMSVGTSQDKTRAIQILDAHVEELKRIPLYSQDIWRHVGPPVFVRSPEFIPNANDPDFQVVDDEFIVSYWIDTPKTIPDRWLGGAPVTTSVNVTATIARDGEDPVDNAIQRLEFVKYWVTDN